MRKTSLSALNMALRPSSLLLLLLVMIPAITMLEQEVFDLVTHCERPNWHCYFLLDRKHDLERTTGGLYENGNSGGIALDTNNPNEWHVTFHFLFDNVKIEYGCLIKIYSTNVKMDIQANDVVKEQNLNKYKGVTIVPKRWDYSKSVIEFSLKAPEGQYVSDAFELYDKPDMSVGIHKVARVSHGIADNDIVKQSELFKPFECKLNDKKIQPDPTATQATLNKPSMYMCSAGTYNYLHGINTNEQIVYCSEGGWVGGTSRTMIIPERVEEKEVPFCWKDTMFKECIKNKCFVFGDALTDPKSPDDLIKETSPAKIAQPLGAYVEFSDDDKTWNLQIAHKKDMKLVSFSVASEVFTVTSSVFSSVIAGKRVTATMTRNDPGTITGITVKKFKLEANADQSDKDLMSAFGFYNELPNKIVLIFDETTPKNFDAEGVANYPTYVRPQDFVFNALGFVQKNQPDINNLFKCSGDQHIYLDNNVVSLMNVNVKEIRFTARGWLSKDGTVGMAATKDANGKDESVNCFSACQDATINGIVRTAGGSKPTKTDGVTPLEFSCKGSFVKVNDKLFEKLTCANNEWKGDGEVISLRDADHKIDAECYGANTIVKVCSSTETLAGCRKATEANGVISCDPGFALTIEGSTNPNAIYGTLKVGKNGHWFDGTKDIEEAKANHKAVCFSKCRKDNVVTKVDATNTDSQNAEYEFDVGTQIGTLKCGLSEVLIATLEGQEKQYFETVTCDKDGWKEGSTLKKGFSAETAVTNLAVKAECYKACRDSRTDCAAGLDAKFGCQKPAFSAQTLACPDTHVLVVDDKVVDKKLECTGRGWKKEGEPNLFIAFSATALRPTIKPFCFDKCGKQFVTGTAPFAGGKIECDGSDMISYIKDSDPAVDTLEEMICDKTGWKVGTDVITFAPGEASTIKAECKPSCNAQLVKDDCTTDLPYCEKALFKNDEWSCSEGHVLFSSESFKASEDPIKCQKKTLGNDKISIPRKTPTEQAAVSCFSICEEDFFEHKKDEIVKTLGEKGSFTMKCKDNLHHLGVSYGTDAPTFLAEFKCTTTGEIASVMKTHLGAKATVTCRNKCNNRIKEDSCGAGDADCVKPPDAIANKLTCDDAHVMRIKTSVETKYISGNALECKTDGFYENTEKMLSFKDDPNEDNEKFDIACISTCDSELALSQNAEITKNSNPKRNGDVVQCQDVAGQILHVTYGEATIRAFGPATCDKNSGWTGVNAKETPRGMADGHIVKFAGDKAQLKTQCLKVCDGAMVRDMKDEKDTNGNPLCPAADLCTPIKHTLQDNTLQCDDNYRLFINDKNNDNTAVTVTREKTMVCTNEGWTEGTEKVVDFKDPTVDITKPVEAICKNKCNPHFITFTNEEECPKETECSKPFYDPSSKTLKCSDTTEVLVLEHEGKLMESFSGAKCDPVKGWSTDEHGNSQELFTMAGLNFRVKARCEQLCAFNMDKAALNAETESGLDYDRVAKTLTCNGTNEMLALSGVGVYSDLTCTKDGWITDAKIKDADGNPVKKIEFKPIIASNADAAKEQRDERAKKFTCVTNDCLRSFKCKGHEYTKVGTDEDCINPDITKIKYEMSCTSPSKLTSPKTQGLSYDTLRCFDGAWKAADQSTLIDKLNPDSNELTKPVSERPAFDVFCNADACTGCKADDLAIIKSTTDANIAAYQFNEGTFTTCSNFRCSGADYLVEESGKNKYYRNTGANPIKCSSNKQETRKTFTAPDGKSIIGGKVGCVKKIPCNEHRPLQTDCQGLKSTCDSDAFQQRLKIGSLTSESEPVTCDTLGRMYYQKDAGKTGWKIVDKLLCTKTGDWSVTYHEVKDEKKEHVFGPETLPETMNLDSSKAGTNPRVICTVSDPNPEAKKQDSDPKTETCTFCPFPSALECNEDCKNAQDHATITNDGNGKCTMKIINGRFKINGGDEMDKGVELICQMINGEYPWMTPDGKKINSLAVIMKGTDNISTGAIAGIVIGVILALGLIVFAMVYVTIRKRKEIERQEKLKNKGLEQKQDSIIDGATIVDDSKTLVL